MAGLGSLLSGSGAPQETDYANKIQQGLAKLSAVNPEMGSAYANAYESRATPSNSLLGGIWNAVWGAGKGVGGGIINALGNVASSFAEPFRNEEEGEEDNFIVDFYQGMAGHENTSWQRNLGSYGMEGGWQRTVMGTALDIFADPTNYIGAGGLGLAKDVIATGGKELAEFGAKEILQKEVAEQGGIKMAGQLVVRDEDFAAQVAKIGQETFAAQKVSADAIDGLVPIAAHNAERKLLTSVDDVVQREVEEIGEYAASTILRKRNLQALDETYKSKTTGRIWKREEIQAIFKDVETMKPHQLRDLAQRMFPEGGVTDPAQMMMARKAAAAMGGIRLKFGIPFGEKMAKSMNDAPFLAYRWQSKPIATRFRLGEREIGATQVGNFFRGLSGIEALDGAIQQGLKSGDSVWDREAMDVFLHAEEGGYAGLKRHMYNKGIKGQEEFKRVMGTKSKSLFIPWSERAGLITEALTPGARAWRRDGYYGLRSAQLSRTAKNRQKEFRAFASQYTEEWGKVALKLSEEAKDHPTEWSEKIYGSIIKYVEGTDEALDGVPDYLVPFAKSVRPAFEEMHETLTKKMGVTVGDMRDVYARNKHDQALSLIQKRIKTIDDELAKMDSTGADVVEGDALLKEQVRLMDEQATLKAEATDLKTQLDNMDSYDDLIRKMSPNELHTASPKAYFHRRFTREAKAALRGNFQAQTKSYNKAKKLTAELERKMANMTFEEAQKALRDAYPEALGDIGKVFEDNPFQVFAHYIEDMSEAVLKTELRKGAEYMFSRLGAIDNGAATKVSREIVDPDTMPRAYAKMQKLAAGMDPGSEHRAAVNHWMEQLEEKLGVVAVGAPAKKTEIWHHTAKEWAAKAKPAADGAAKEFDSAAAKNTLRTVANGIRRKTVAKGADGAEALSDADFKNLSSLLLKAEGAARKPTAAKIKALQDAMAELSDPDLIGMASKLDDFATPTTAAKAVDPADHKRAVLEALERGETVPTAVLREYPDVMEKLVKFPESLSVKEAEKLQTTFRELNRLSAQMQGAVAIPEVAFKKVGVDMNMTKWGRLDVPGLEDYAMHPLMAAEFNKAWHGVGKNINGFQRNWRKFLMGPWKEWATLYWPGFHARNAMGAWFNNELQGVGRRHYGIMKDVQGVLREGKDHALFNKPIPGLEKMRIDGQLMDMTYGRMSEMMQDLGIVGGNSQALADLRTYLQSRDFLSLDPGHSISRRMKFTGTFKSDQWGEVTGAEFLARKWKGKGMSATNGIENFFRGSSFLKGLEEAAGDTAAARASMMMRHGDYDELTDAENIIKDALPFYKWMRTNLPFQMRQLIESPGKQLAVLDVQRNLVSEGDRKLLPEWMRESMLIHLPWSKNLGKDGTDESAAFLMFQLPLHDIFMTTNEFASGFLPVVRNIVLENGLFKKSMFTGQALEGVKTEKLGLLGKVPGVGLALEATGIAQRDADGDLTLNDRQINVLNTLPFFARSRNWLMEDEDRSKLRIGSLVSALSGVGLRKIGDEELNEAEADYYYTHIEPAIRGMKEKGWVMPSISDWTSGSSGGSGLGGVL